MTYRTVTAMVGAMALSASLVAAQPPGRGPGYGADRQNGGWERGQAERLERMTEFLDLSDAQALEIEAMLAEQREARRDSLESMRATGESLRTLLDSDAPDPVAVGREAIEMHTQRKAIGTRHEADIAALRGMLTPEQAEKFDTMLEMREMRRGSRDRDHRGRRGSRSGRPGSGG